MADAPGNIRNKLVDMFVVWQTGFHMKTVVCKLLCFNEKKTHFTIPTFRITFLLTVVNESKNNYEINCRKFYVSYVRTLDIYNFHSVVFCILVIIPMD
jgi:hypothetical protein